MIGWQAHIAAKSFRQRIFIFLLVSLSASLAFGSRHLFGYGFHGQNYTPFSYDSRALHSRAADKFVFTPEAVVWDETRAYARFSQEIARGEFCGATLSSFRPLATVPAGGETICSTGRLGPALMAGLALIGGNMERAFVAADFLFPALLVLSLLLLFDWLSGSIPFAVAAAVIVACFNWQDTLTLLHLDRNHLEDLGGLIYLRTPYPQISTALLSLFLLFLSKLHERLTVPNWICAVLVLTAAFYSYFYTWSLALMVLACAGALNVPPVFRRGKRDRGAEREFVAFALLGITALVLSTPAWLFLIRPSQVFHDQFVRVFGEFSRKPEWPYTAIVVVALGAAWLSRINARSRWLWTVFFLGHLITINQQLITGKINQNHHYYGAVLQPFMLVFAMQVGVSFVPRSVGLSWLRAQWFAAWAAALLVVLGFGIVAGRGYAAAHVSGYTMTDADFRGLVNTLGDSRFAEFGIAVDDPYVEAVLPAFVRMKPLDPWYMDPLSNQQLRDLRNAVRNEVEARYPTFFESMPTIRATLSGPQDGVIKLWRDRILLVFNLVANPGAEAPACAVVMRNRSFLLAKLTCESTAPTSR